MELAEICKKIDIPVEDGEKVKIIFQEKMQRLLGEPFSEYLTKEKTLEQWVDLGLLLRDSCRGLPEDPLSGFLTAYVLPMFYQELKKVKDFISILNIIKEKEEFNPRVWTLKHLASNINISTEILIVKMISLQKNSDLNARYSIGIRDNKTFDLINKEGEVVANKIGLFLGSFISGEKRIIWKWLKSIGPIPPIDAEFIDCYLLPKYRTSQLDLDEKDFWLLISMLAVIFNLSQVEVIEVEEGQKIKLCVGFK